MHDELLDYADLWTNGRYALVDVGDGVVIFDLEARAPLVIDVDAALYARIVARMRDAGAPALGPEDVKPA